MRKTKAIKKTKSSSSSLRRKSLRRKSSKRTIGGASSFLSNFSNMTNGLNKFVPQNNALNQLNNMNNVAQQANNVAQQAKTVMTGSPQQQQQPQYVQQQPQYVQQQPQYVQQQSLPQKQPTFSGLKNLATNLGFIQKKAPATAPVQIQQPQLTLEQRLSNVERMLNLSR